MARRMANSCRRSRGGWRLRRRRGVVKKVAMACGYEENGYQPLA
jgi:hypothetical protein